MRPSERAGRSGGAGAWAASPCFAALDLGTNNCRLLLARPDGAGFRVIGGYSEIVRLGEGLTAIGRLSDAAMARAYRALSVCADRIAAREPTAVGCIATQACRIASNGPAFLDRIRNDFGLDFEIITHEQESQLAVLGCAGLLDQDADVALIVDIGGGSTELSWVSPRAVKESLAAGKFEPPILAWGTAPFGVVTLAEEAPEPNGPNGHWYEAMVQRLMQTLSKVGDADALRPAFESGSAHIVGTSGTVTSLAGVHLGLSRYQRTRVDGLWLTMEECRAAVARLLAMPRDERAANPCIGPDRVDLVVPGGAILEAVARLWPASRIRVADRGLREGVLMRLIAAHGARR